MKKCMYVGMYVAVGDRDDECSAAKNVGKAAWKIAGVVSKQEEKPKTVIFYLHEAIKRIMHCLQSQRGL